MMPFSDLPKASIIIATYNRPQELTVAIASILDQTVHPHEIIVVDDGALTDPPLQAEAKRKGIRYIYIRKSPENRGLTRSRNVGIEAATGDILFFLDDDIQLFSDFLENSLACYHKHPHIDGMGGGEILNKKPSIAQKLWFAYGVVFCMTGFKKGYFLPSAFSTNLGNPNLKTRFGPVEFLGGASFSFRRHVFETARFSEEFAGYGLGEDKEFSYRVSCTHTLYANPAAKLYHFESPVMRYQKYDRAKATVLSKHHFLTDCNVKNRFKGFWFCHAMTGYLLKRVILMLISFDKGEVDRVSGTLSGIFTILKKRQIP
jgi:glycosyltransferase involved in cell wall biosynthesis